MLPAPRDEILSQKAAWNLALGYGRLGRGRRLLLAALVLLALASFPVTFVLNESRKSRHALKAMDERLDGWQRSLERIPLILIGNGQSDHGSWKTLAASLSSSFRELTIDGYVALTPGIPGPEPELQRIDVASDPALMSATIEARDSGRPVMLVSAEGGGTKLLLPVYLAHLKPDQLQVQRQTAAGWLVATVEVEPLIRSMISDGQESDITVLDEASETLIGEIKARERAVGVKTSHRATVFGRDWQIGHTRKFHFREILFGPAAIVPLLIVLVPLLIVTEISRRRRSFELGDKMLDALADVIMVVSGEHRIVYVSSSVQRSFGVAAESLHGTSFFDMFHPDGRAVLTAALEDSTVDTGVETPALRISGPLGVAYEVEVTIRRIVADQREVGYLVIVHDITGILQLRRQLERIERVESLGRVAATITHEFNNVLQAVQMNLDLLRLKAGQEEVVRSACETIGRNLARGRHIAEGVLRYAQPAKVALGTIDVNSWIHVTTQDLRALLSSHQLSVEMDVDSGLLLGDEDQLAQVLTNLTLNARDATALGETIRIRVKMSRGGRFHYGIVPGGRFIHIEVADQGEGMPPEVLERIFEPLFTTKKNGTGLGLAVSHQIVTAHRGLIFASSRVGEGTEFHIFLPTFESAAVHPATMVHDNHAVM